jgi:hypothetical protein
MTGKMWELQRGIISRLNELHLILEQIEKNADKIAYLKGLLAKEDFKRRAIV